MSTNRGLIPFPKQTVSDSEKRTKEYGLMVAHAIESEWWLRDDSGQSGGRYRLTRDEMHRRRVYARGEQSVSKYRDEISINGDSSHFNMEWKPVAIINKYVDIVVNGMQDRLFTIKAESIDPISTEKRIEYVKKMQEDINTRAFTDQAQQALGLDISNFPRDEQPDTPEDLDLYMKIGYKQGIEIAIEQAVKNVMNENNYDEIKRRIDYDLVVLGISAVKHGFNTTDGITVEYVDPADLVYSEPENGDFSKCYYFGEVKRVHANEINKQFPEFSNEKIQEILNAGTQNVDYDEDYSDSTEEYDSNTIQIMYFCWKTWKKDVHKVKETASGGLKAIEKDDTFNPRKEQAEERGFEKVEEAVEVIYEGAYLLGTNEILSWKLAENVVKPKSNANQVMMNYSVQAPRYYNGRIESLVERMTPFGDLIQKVHLKLQQAIQRMIPSGVIIDVDAILDVDLGNGTLNNAQDIINMYLNTGSMVSRSISKEGDPNPTLPITPVSGSGGEQIQQLIGTYHFYLSQIQDVTGLNSARDGSDPDQYSLVGVQKLAAANSNTATRHIQESSMAITKTIAEAVVTRFKDVMEYHPEKEAFISSLGKFNVSALEELNEVHLHDFGIALILDPDEEEKQYIEANIQAALAKDSITLEDAIDVRQIANVKLANELLKSRRRRKAELDHQRALEAQQAQAKAQGEAALVSEKAKADAEMIKAEAKIKEASAQNELDIKKQQIEAELKKELMRYEFELNRELKEMDLEASKAMADSKNKTDLAKVNSSPPKSAKPQKPFESKGNDVLGGFGTERFGNN